MGDFITSNPIYRVRQEHSLQNLAIKRAGGGFDAVLQQELHKADELQFSKHSRERIQQRGISLTEELMADMNAAAGKARLKGAKDVVMIGKKIAQKKGMLCAVVVLLILHMFLLVRHINMPNMMHAIDA
ncbi:MAG: hypothetical protein IKA89_02280, partial [Anaerotignum sp.]|nr:hypothetical protein [Anaerotignum sp.]